MHFRWKTHGTWRHICRSVGDADIDQLSRHVRVVAKLCLKNSLEIRELQAATLATYVVPKENELVQATVDATKAYADSVAEANKITAERERQSKLGQVGAAHAHHWAAVVRVAAASNSLTEEERAQVAAHISALSTPEQVTEIIYVSKSKKAYDKRQIKMHFAVAESANHILALIGKVLMPTGAKRKKGKPPRAGLEREVQEFLPEVFDD